MYRAYALEDNHLYDMVSYSTLDAAVADIHQSWNESDGPQIFLICNEEKVVEATMLRPVVDPELCLTLYRDGKVETHRCHYVLDADGKYDHTVVTLQLTVLLT